MPAPVIPPQLFAFLKELAENNDRDWFAERKADYQADVLGPAVALAEALEKPLAKIAPMLTVIPKAHNGSVMRIYRDTRFSKDKTPYKTNVGISIRHQADGDIHAPGVYIQLEPKNSFIGAGCWRPPRESLAAIRAAIDEDPKGWIRARDSKAFASHWSLAGESLKTSPRDYGKDHPMIEDLRRIDFIATAPLSDDQITSTGCVPLITERIKTARPLMKFLCGAIGVPY